MQAIRSITHCLFLLIFKTLLCIGKRHINMININKIKTIKSTHLMLVLEDLHELFCNEYNWAKDLYKQLAIDVNELSDEDFEKKHNLTKCEYTGDGFNIYFYINCNGVGQLVAKLLDLTENQITSSGYALSSLGYEVAKLYIQDAEFHDGIYSPENDGIDFLNVNLGSDETKSSLTLFTGEEYCIISAA